MAEEKNLSYPACMVPSGTMHPPVRVVVLDDNRKSVIKRYPDGRSLTMLVVDDKIIEKHLTYKMKWDLEVMKQEQDKGADGVSFKYWENKGGLAVLNSFFGTYIVGLMFSLDYTLVTNSRIRSEKLQDELDNDIDFPMVDVRKLAMEDGYSSSQKENEKLATIMHERICDALTKFDRTKAADGGELLEKKRKAEEAVHQCEICGEKPCVWTTERDTVVAKDEMEHGHTNAIANSARRKTAYRHMFYVTNGGYGSKGVRKRLPECIEIGVRGLFPDVEHMGFKEE
jgi:hypothetical protein